jgi:hypothetical protein
VVAVSTAVKLAQRRQHTGVFGADQAQRLAQDAARQVNSHTDMLNALLNRSFTALTTDTGTIAAGAYATLLTANITTVLASGYLLITFTASGVEVTTLGTASFQILVDGVVRKGAYTTVGAGSAFTAAIVIRVPVTRGAHVVLAQWKTSVANARINAATVNEEHAAMLVQEAA